MKKNKNNNKLTVKRDELEIALFFVKKCKKIDKKNKKNTVF